MLEIKQSFQETEAFVLMSGAPGKPNTVTMRGDRTDDELDRNEATRDLVAETSFRTNRKKRMARQRRVSINPLPFASSSSHVQTLPVDGSSALAARDIEVGKLRFLLQKELRNSDVSSLGRMVLPKRAAEAHLPILDTKEGMFIDMDDMDGLRVWNFKYRFWPNNNSRMYILENIGEFVKMHGLQLGDFIMLYRDDQNQKYVIRARKASDQDIFSESTRNSFFGISTIKDCYVPEVEVNKPSYLHVNFPTVDDIGLPFPCDNDFSDAFPIALSGGSMVDFPGLEPIANFGSVENLSLDDFL
ncbi:PREDICTED: B3 domain-containing transcription factor FUS3-like isoform X2 [Nelumbo nucifera]|uniref:B3 domain-containing transcription factor FUS3-like isoform X2 n=1 Tax=Nelumbo nucifera TaxID=4432 RepID=A0A1U7Z764_NELNU|nr:PREDICTED: B3 domain-containing transcription factor FUS3-like isoform X2 [Nelumbo nucifera]